MSSASEFGTGSIRPAAGLWSQLTESLANHAHRVVMAVLFGGALVAGYNMLPGVSEKVAALEKDGQFRLALRTLEQQYDQGDRRQRTLFQMHRLYEQFGEIAGARRVLEQLVEQRPRDLNLNRQLAALLRQMQDEPAYIAAVRTGLKLRYSEPACHELIGLWRRDGNAAEEERQIKECRELGYDRTEDIVRLAYLSAVSGKLEPAAVMLRALDDRRRLDQPREQLSLFAILLELNEAKDAYRRGLRWFRSSGDETLALSLIDFLADDDRHELALEFAKNTGSPGDSLSLAIPELMLDRGQLPAAKSLLALWLERAKLDQLGLADRFIEASLVAGDVELAFTGAQRFGLNKLSQALLASLAEALAAAGRQPDFDAVRAYMTAETVSANPLIEATIALVAGETERARKLIGPLDATDLDEWRAALLAQISAKTYHHLPKEPSPVSAPPPPAAIALAPVAADMAPGSASQAPGAVPQPPAVSQQTQPAAQPAATEAPVRVARPARPLRSGRRTRRPRTPLVRPPGKERLTAKERAAAKEQ